MAAPNNLISDERFLNCYISYIRAEFDYYNRLTGTTNPKTLDVLLVDDIKSNAIMTNPPKIGDTLTFKRGTLTFTGQVVDFQSQIYSNKGFYNNGYATDSIIINTADGKTLGSNYYKFKGPHTGYYVKLSSPSIGRPAKDPILQGFVKYALVESTSQDPGSTNTQRVNIVVEIPDGGPVSAPFGYNLNINELFRANSITIDRSFTENGDNLYSGLIPAPLNYLTLEGADSGATGTTGGTGTTGSTGGTGNTTSIPVYSIKYFNAYVQSFSSSINNAACVLNLTVAEDPSTGLVFTPPVVGQQTTFTFDSFKFVGEVASYTKISAATDAIKRYLVVINGIENISNLSDQIFGLDVASVSANLPATASLSSAGSTSLSVDALVITDQLPTLTVGSTYTWRSSSSPSYTITAAYYSNSTTSYRSPGGTPYFSLQSRKAVSVGQILVNSASNGAVSDPNAGGASGGATSITTGGSTGSTGSAGSTTITSNINDYGAGTKTTVAPNSSNLPPGVTSSSFKKDGLDVQVATTITANTVTTVESFSFTPTLNTSPNAVQTRAAMGVPKNFNGAVDPMKIFPSVEIYPSSSYPKTSGLFFGRSISPTSFDLDPYFYFAKNDFRIAVKDGKSNSKNINLQKESVQSNVRTMGLKGPMLYSGWGYDSRGLPVPNNVVNNASSGVFQFNPLTGTQRKLWKTGPVDLRWHDVRKVWIGGHEMLEGYLKTSLSTTGLMSVMRVAGNKNGPPETVLVTNRDPSLTATSGTYIMVVDINYEWRPIYIGC